MAHKPADRAANAEWPRCFEAAAESSWMGMPASSDTTESTRKMTEARILNVPDMERCEFERNLISLAVCELRFPHLLEFETQPPQKLQRALRKTYPHFNTKTNVSLSPGDLKRDPRYIFSSKKKDWTVTFGPYSLALETDSYRTFEGFWRRFQEMLEVAMPILDTDFFTRVGLRYVNRVSIDLSEPEKWINSELVSPLASKIYGDVTEYSQIIRSLCKGGALTFRHGIGVDESGNPIYLLDTDFSAEEVSADNLVELLIGFSRQNYNHFRWAIGEKAVESMGIAKTKS